MSKDRQSWGFLGGTSGNASACQCRRHKRHGFNPRVGKIPRRRTWQPTQYSCLKNPMCRGAWWATVHGDTKVRHSLATKQSPTNTENRNILPRAEETATHSCILAWRIPWRGTWRATVHRVAQSWTPLKRLSMYTGKVSQPLAPSPLSFLHHNAPYVHANKTSTCVSSLRLHLLHRAALWPLLLPREKEMATHSSILAWKIPWTEDPGRLQTMGSQRVGHDWATSLHFLPREADSSSTDEPQRGELHGC